MYGSRIRVIHSTKSLLTGDFKGLYLNPKIREMIQIAQQIFAEQVEHSRQFPHYSKCGFRELLTQNIDEYSACPSAGWISVEETIIVVSSWVRTSLICSLVIKTSVVHLKEFFKTTCPDYIPRKCQLPKNSDHTLMSWLIEGLFLTESLELKQWLRMVFEVGSLIVEEVPISCYLSVWGYTTNHQHWWTIVDTLQVLVSCVNI